MSKDLVACPFCGNVIRSEELSWSILINTYTGERCVQCDKCKCKGPLKKTNEEAIESWNGRNTTNTLRDPCWNCGNSGWDCNLTSHRQKCVRYMEYEDKKLGIKWCPLSKDGELMTIERFRDTLCAWEGSGMGYYAQSNRYSQLPVDFNVASLTMKLAGGKFTHVMWFNK